MSIFWTFVIFTEKKSHSVGMNIKWNNENTIINSLIEYDIYIFLIFILFFAGVLLKGLTKRNLMDLNMSTHCLCQLKTKSNQRIHVQRNLKIVHFIAFIRYDRYINAAILIHTIFTKKTHISTLFCTLSKSNFHRWRYNPFTYYCHYQVDPDLHLNL